MEAEVGSWVSKVGQRSAQVGTGTGVAQGKQGSAQDEVGRAVSRRSRVQHRF
jgi:hypothetical protein